MRKNIYIYIYIDIYIYIYIIPPDPSKTHDQSLNKSRQKMISCFNIIQTKKKNVYVFLVNLITYYHVLAPTFVNSNFS